MICCGILQISNGIIFKNFLECGLHYVPSLKKEEEQEKEAERERGRGRDTDIDIFMRVISLFIKERC